MGTTHTNPSVKEAVLSDIKNGMKVSEAARTHGVKDSTIYNWLRLQADNTGSSNLEVAKLKRENQELKELVGMLTLEQKRASKNTGRA